MEFTFQGLKHKKVDELREIAKGIELPAGEYTINVQSLHELEVEGGCIQRMSFGGCCWWMIVFLCKHKD